MKAGAGDGEIERPSLALAREYRGYLNFLSWPYRAYQWAKYFLTRDTKPTTSVPTPQKVWDGTQWVKPAAKKKKRRQAGKEKVVRYGMFLGNGWLVGLPLFFGIVTIFMSYDGGSPFNPNDPVHSTRLGYFLWGSFLTFCGIAYYIVKKREVNWHDVVPDPRSPDDPPPTPEETKQAHNHLRVALAYKHDVFEEKTLHLQQALLTQAATALAHARSLDPAVTIEDTSGDTPLTYTQDALAGELLYFESLAYTKQADAASENASDTYRDKHLMRRYEAEALEHRKLALVAIQKALKYDTNTFYMRHAIGIYNRLDETKKARQMLADALQRNPDDIELLKLQSQMR